MDPLASRVSKVIIKDFEDESTWEKKVSTVARHLNHLIQDTFTMIGKHEKCEKGKEKIKSLGGAFIEVPQDVLEFMDNPLENKNSDKLKEGNEDERRKKAEEFARHNEQGDTKILISNLKEQLNIIQNSLKK